MGAQTALIFGSMDCGDWSFLEPLRMRQPLVICADGGLACALRAGFQPDCYVGDGDSGGKAVEGAENLMLRPEKDETDLQAAYTLARRHGCREVYFTGCSGGRQDHHIAGLQLLETARSDGCRRRCWTRRIASPASAPGHIFCRAVDFVISLCFPSIRCFQSCRWRGRNTPCTAPLPAGAIR